MKRLLFITLLMLSVSYSFAQQKNSSGWTFHKKEYSKTITKTKASPNPFYEQTTIIFESSQPQTIIFSVKNLLGKVVHSERLQAKQGENRIPFRRKNLQQGVYIYSIQTANEVVVKRLVVR